MRVLHFHFDRQNPYQGALAAELARLQVDVNWAPLQWNLIKSAWKSDIIHFHWIHALSGSPRWKFTLGLALLVLQLAILRASGRRMIWTAHNLTAHEKQTQGRDWLLGLLLSHLVHAVVVHGLSAKTTLRRRFRLSGRKISIIPHGNSIGQYPDGMRKDEARQLLGLDKTNRVLLFLGHIRPYKGVEDLVAAFRKLAIPESVLLVAGRSMNATLEAQLRLIADGKSIRFYPGIVPNERIQVFMNAADAVVLPYRNVFSSGAVLLAMSFAKPCVAPRLGPITDILDDRGAFLYQPHEAAGLSEALRRTLSSSEILSEMGRHNLLTARRWSWERVARATLDLYEGRTQVPENSFLTPSENPSYS